MRTLQRRSAATGSTARQTFRLWPSRDNRASIRWRDRPGVWSLIFVFAVCPALLGDEKTDFEISFRDGKFDNKMLVPTSQGHATQTKLENDGVHLASSPGQLVNNLGFGPRFKLRGDFEITAGYSLIRVPQPADGFGAGAVIQFNLEGPGRSTAIMGRLCRKDGKQVISTYAASGAGNDRKAVARMFPSSASNGKLRVARSGATLTFAVAEGSAESFRTLTSVPIDAADVTLLRCGLQQSHVDADVEVAWHDLRIHAAELVNLPDSLPAGEKQHRPQLQVRQTAPFPWGWASATGILGVSFVAYWWRQRLLSP